MSWWTEIPIWTGNYPTNSGGYPAGPTGNVGPGVTTINLNKKEETNMLFAVTIIQQPRVDKSTVMYGDEEIIVKGDELIAMDANQATLITGAVNADVILKAVEAKSKIRAVVRQLGA